MDKHEVAAILEEIAFLLEILGENVFKVRAYHTAAKAIDSLDEELEKMVKEERLQQIPGIGEGIASKISILVNKGRLPYYEKLKKMVPEGLLELIKVPGLGPKKVMQLYKELHIKSLKELTDACQKGKVSQLAGFGPKTEKNILDNLKKLKVYGKRMLWWDARELALPIADSLSQLKKVDKVEVAGSFRRKLETVGDLDFLVASNAPAYVMEWFTTQPFVEKVQSKGTTKASVRLKGGLQADVRVIPKADYAFALLYFTGSKEFSILLRQRANTFGYSLSEYGLESIPGKGKKQLRCQSEEDIFKILKLTYIPPELREGFAEIEAAEKGKLPKLIEETDIKGVFHCHTTDSDGHQTLEEMAAAADEMKWEYLGFADHSKSSYQANGMNKERLFKQIERIHKLNRSKKFYVHLFTGLECDILKNGSLDFPDEILKELDYVIASVHSAFKLDETTMTARIIKAIENPYTTMVGHVTGRLLLKREAYQVNLPKVIDACIANHKIMELNAHPMRLDMDWRLWHRAAEKGLMCSINPDAHSTSDLYYYLAGVNCARKGWLERSHILNTFSISKVKKYFKEKVIKRDFLPQV